MTAAAELNLSVEAIAAGDAGGEWQRYVQSHTLSTIYHSLAWRRIFEETFGYRSWYLVAIDGGAIAGCLPLFLVSSPIARRLVSVPFRDRGGVLWSTPVAFSTLVETAKRIAQEEKASYLELKTITPYPEDVVQQSGLAEHRYWIRSTIDLRPLNADIFWKKIGPKTRNMIRQAEAAGLTFRDETGERDAVLTWYALFLETQKRRGLPPFAQHFFRSMLEELAPGGEARLFVVRHGSEALSATIILMQKKTAIYGYAASAGRGQAFRPNDFMLFSTARWLMEHGYDEFDLGSDAPTQQSLLFFKRKWLAEHSVAPVYTFGRYSRADSDSSDARYRVARKAFRYLPSPVLRLLGAATCRFFG